MTIGNLPKERNLVETGVLYWRLSVGKDALTNRFFEGGWRAFEFVMLKPKKFPLEGESMPYIFRFAFAYWLPFYSLK